MSALLKSSSHRTFPRGFSPRLAVGASFLSLFFVATGFDATTSRATGIVFEDLDGDGQRDPSEPGLAGVRVSDGRHIVLTDDAGRWELDVEDEAVLFITKPRGWRTPLDENGLPRFYYIHRPEGSPADLRYRGVDPTGPLPASIDFPLVRQQEATSFEVLLFADPQPQTEAELDYLRDDVITPLVGSDAAFGMTLGDIMFDDLSLLPRLNAIVGRIGIPWYNVPGNHELNFEAADDRHSLETFTRFFGPPYYSFEYADALFVVLDNIEYQGHAASDPDNVRGNGGYIAKLGELQLRWLEKELAHVPEDKLVFLAMHAPLETYVSDGPSVTTQDRRQLLGLLEGRPNLYSVAGHTHTTEHLYFNEEDGFGGPGTFHHHILTTASGSWWSGPFDERGIPETTQRDGTPNGHHVLEVEGTSVRMRYQAAGAPATEQMRILFDVAHHGLSPDVLRQFRPGELHDGRIAKDAVPAAEILVNLYDGGPRSAVAFSIDGGRFHDMRRISRKDPHIVETLSRHQETVKGWVQAVPSSHLWSADLPDELALGAHTLTVRAIDEFERVHHAHRILEIHD